MSPTILHQHQNTYFLFISRLVSSEIETTDTICVFFNYHMNGQDVGQIKVFQVAFAAFTDHFEEGELYELRQTGYKSSEWHYASTTKRFPVRMMSSPWHDQTDYIIFGIMVENLATFYTHQIVLFLFWFFQIVWKISISNFR